MMMGLALTPCLILELALTPYMIIGLALIPCSVMGLSLTPYLMTGLALNFLCRIWFPVCRSEERKYRNHGRDIFAQLMSAMTFMVS
jgi:hypothetical protein